MELNCPSLTPAECSGHGRCISMCSGGSLNCRFSCKYANTISRFHSGLSSVSKDQIELCVIPCRCDDGFGSDTCGLSSAVVQSRQALQATLLSHIGGVVQSVDATTLASDTTVSALTSAISGVVSMCTQCTLSYGGCWSHLRFRVTLIPSTVYILLHAGTQVAALNASSSMVDALELSEVPLTSGSATSLMTVMSSVCKSQSAALTDPDWNATSAYESVVPVVRSINNRLAASMQLGTPPVTITSDVIQVTLYRTLSSQSSEGSFSGSSQTVRFPEIGAWYFYVSDMALWVWWVSTNSTRCPRCRLVERHRGIQCAAN